jgi:hypothetical protein
MIAGTAKPDKDLRDTSVWDREERDFRNSLPLIINTNKKTI